MEIESNKDLCSPEPTGSAGPAIPAVSIPDHQLLRQIGRGSYGDVWMARSSMGMLRAIKIVHRKSFKDSRPFERELSGIRKFEPISRSHEGFIDVLHAGINEQEGYFYYIMELADDIHKGQDIDPTNYHPRTLARELAPQGKLPLQECLSLGLALSRALAELHKHGLVHRDIKPSNIIFVHGAPKLADIGLVADMNEARSYVGTEGFIPPEGPGKPQADIYGLGKVLYEACTGRDRNEFPDLPTNWDHNPESDLFLELNEVILHACTIDTGRRYHSAADMHADLVLVSNGKSVRRLRVLERRWAKLKGAAVVSGVALLLISAIAYHFYFEWRTRLEMRQREVGGLVVSGTTAVENGDLFKATTNFTRCLALDSGDASLAALHRFRLGSVLSFCPKIERMSFSTNPIDRISLAPDGLHLLITRDPGAVRAWEPGQPSPGAPLFNRSSLHDAQYTADGSCAILAEESGASVWRLADGLAVAHFPHARRVLSATGSSDGHTILTCCEDRVARLWDLKSSRIEHELRGHLDAVGHGAFSPNGELVGTGGHDATAILWNRATGKQIKAFPHDAKSWVNGVAFSPDGTLFATACSDHKARVFDVKTGTLVPPVLQHDEGVSAVEFSADGRFLLTSSLDHLARIWLVKTHELLLPNGILPHSERVMDAHFLPDVHHIVTASYDGTLRLWDLAGAMVLPPPLDSAFSQDGNTVLERSNLIVTAKDSLSGGTFTAWTNDLENPAFELSANGRFAVEYAASKTNSERPRELNVRDARAGALMASIHLPEPLRGACIDNFGKVLVTFGETNFYLWDATRGQQLRPAFSHTQEITSAFISDDGRLAGFWSATGVRLWESATGRELLNQSLLPNVRAVVLSPDSSLLATCCADDDFHALPVQLWNTGTGKPMPFRLVHNDGVICAAFSPDGSRIVTGSEDFTARIWDTKTGRPMGEPMKHRERVNSVAYSPDGKWILTASADKTARIWSAETGDPLTPPLRHFLPLRKAVFVANATAVVTVDREPKRRMWQLRIEQAPVAELTDLSRFLAGQVSAPPLSVGSDNVDNGTASNAWFRLQATRPDLSKVSTERIIAWHDFEAQESNSEGDWKAAAFHLRKLLDASPDNISARERLKEIEGHLQEQALETIAVKTPTVK